MCTFISYEKGTIPLFTVTFFEIHLFQIDFSVKGNLIISFLYTKVNIYIRIPKNSKRKTRIYKGVVLKIFIVKDISILIF